MRRTSLLIVALAAPLAGCMGMGPDSAPTSALIPAAETPAPASPPSPSGGLLGGGNGPALADADRQAAYDARLAALDSGQRRSWRGAKGVFGFVEPGAAQDGGCRAYAETIFVGGRAQRGQGVVCRQGDGAWTSKS